jgi:hypothetical protein
MLVTPFSDPAQEPRCLTGCVIVACVCVQVLLEKSSLVAHWLACAGSVKKMMMMIDEQKVWLVS